MRLLTQIPAFDPDGNLNVVIETPKGSHNKYAYDEEIGTFRFQGVMREGNLFPYTSASSPPRSGRTATRSTCSCSSTCRCLWAACCRRVRSA